MNLIVEWIKVLTATICMVVAGLAPIAAAWNYFLHLAYGKPEYLLPCITAAVLTLPFQVLFGLVLSSHVGGFFIRVWGPKDNG